MGHVAISAKRRVPTESTAKQDSAPLARTAFEQFSQTPNSVLNLQRVIGNQATRKLLQRSTQQPGLIQREAHPEYVEDTVMAQSGLRYGAQYVQELASSTGKKKDIGGMTGKEEVTLTTPNALGIAAPKIVKEFRISDQGLFNDTIWTDPNVIEGRVPTLHESDLPAKIETPQKLFWKSRKSGEWNEFADVDIEQTVSRYNGQLRVTTEDNGQPAFEPYQGQPPQPDGQQVGNLNDSSSEDDMDTGNNQEPDYSDHQPTDLEYGANDIREHYDW
jgi:hypothetical protein